MSAGPPLDQVHLALGHDPLDRRADLRTGGWSAVPGERVLVLLDPTGEVAVTRAADRSARLATVRVGSGPGIRGSEDAGLSQQSSTAPAAADRTDPDRTDPDRTDPDRTDPDRTDPTEPTRPTDPTEPTPTPTRRRHPPRRRPHRPASGAVAWSTATIRSCPPDVHWAGLRDVGLRLPEDERGILAEFLALANWHRTHTRCPRCGTPDRRRGAGLVADLPRGRLRALPAHGPGRHRPTRRRRGQCPARAPDSLARGGVLDPGRLRRAG